MCYRLTVMQQSGFILRPYMVYLVQSLSQAKLELGKVWIQPRNSPMDSSQWCSQPMSFNFNNRNVCIPHISVQHQFIAH